MKLYGVLLLIFVGSAVHAVRADDIEAYFPGGVHGGVFLHILMDLGDSDKDSPLCIYGSDCQPPFMTESAYRHLGDMYAEGEVVTAPGVFKAVLAALLENPLFDDLNLALLISNHQGNLVSGDSPAFGGGAILRGYRPVREQRATFLYTLKSTPILDSGNAHALQPSEGYFEWMRYLRGGEVALGQNTSGNFGLSEPVPDYDREIIADGNYVPPISAQQECPVLYSILFALGSSTGDEDLDEEIAAELALPGPVTFGQMLSYLHDGYADLLPQTASVDALQKTWVVSSRDRPGNAAELSAAGGAAGAFYVDEPVALQQSLTSALAEIVVVAGSSSGPSFSGDVFHPGRALNDLYLSLFSPAGTSAGFGNVKKLQLTSSQAAGAQGDSHDLFDRVVDAQGVPAFELTGENKGRLRAEVLTFWTDPATLPPGDGRVILDGADGPLVARGGAGQKIDGFVNYNDSQGTPVQHFIGNANDDIPVDGFLPRQLFYEPPAGQTFAPLDANSSTLEVLRPRLDPNGELMDEELLTLIRWARGQDTDNGQSSARSWLLGDVFHSRPIALNYGATPGYSAANPNIRLLFGSGEGVFHILENTDTSGGESGREVFGFYPWSQLDHIRWRHDNRVKGVPRRYGVDGAPVVLTKDNNGDGTLDFAVGDEAYVYFGLRRGGRSYYALDVSNPDAVPRLLWKIDATAGGSFHELGLTFSTPLVGKVNYSGEPIDVLIFAGGYNGGWNEGGTARLGKDLGADDDAVGNAVYIVNARTGELVWKTVAGTTGVSTNTHYEHAGLVDSIPSDVSALVSPAGIIHRVYVGDTGGVIWRLDLPQSLGAAEDHRKKHWFITRLAELGLDSPESGGEASEDRRFFHAPDLVHSFDDVGKFDGVVIASGNRADPNEVLVENYLFYIKDRHIVSGSEAVRASDTDDNPTGVVQLQDLADQTLCSDGTELVATAEGSIECGSHALGTGWKVRFTRPGEKGLSTPLTDGGRILVSTFLPGDTSTCFGATGRGRLHVLRLKNATAVVNGQRSYELGPGIPAPVLPVGSAIFLPGGGSDLYDTDGDTVRDHTQLLPSEAGDIYRTYWREPGADPL